MNKKCNGLHHTPAKADHLAASAQYRRDLSDLVSILFAVVLGVGLSEILSIEGVFDGFVLVLAYVAILLSWWGYHWGITKGPPETSQWCFAVDVAIVIVYWFLINIRSPFHWVPIFYTIIFGLYTFWEFFRLWRGGWPGALGPMICNFGFMALMGCLIPWIYNATDPARNWVPLGAVAFLLIIYRVIMWRTYLTATKPPKKKPCAVLDLSYDANLVRCASDARNRAAAKVSGYKVGAAAMGANGGIYQGCNVEFDNFSNTIHAEEAAIAAAVTAGEKRILSIAVVTEGEEPAWPCGMCLQSIYEIGGPDARVIASNGVTTEAKSVRELLPHAFALGNKP